MAWQRVLVVEEAQEEEWACDVLAWLGRRPVVVLVPLQQLAVLWRRRLAR